MKKPNGQRRNLQAPRWSRREIIDAAGRLMARYEAIVGRDYIQSHGLHFNDVYERLLYPEFQIDLYEEADLGTDDHGEKILGRYDVDANVAHLDRVIAPESGDPRRAFTCWHEVAGHGALQGDWLREQLAAGGRGFVNVTDVSLSPDEERVLERQANLFAAHLAAPDWLINYAVHTILRPTRRFVFFGPCLYWLDVHGVPIRKHVADVADLCGWIGSKIAGYFGGLSAQALGYRIREMGWVRDRSIPRLQLHRTATRRRSIPKVLQSVAG